MSIPYRLITISGITCAGTTTLARALTRAIGWPHINPASEYMRAFLAEHGLALPDIDKMPDNNERQTDAHLRSIVENQQHKIINSRLAGYWAKGLPDVFKIFMTAQQDKRIQRYAARENMSFDQARQEVMRRDRNEAQKYARLYQVDARDPKYYDFVIDTSACTPQESLKRTLAAIQKK